MIRMCLLILLQSVLLCGGQVFLKQALLRMGTFSWSWSFFGHQLLNFHWLGCGVCFTSAGILWMYILKHYPFSLAYPLSSITFILGMLAALFVFHENVSWTQWLGVLLIMAGCFFIVK